MKTLLIIGCLFLSTVSFAGHQMGTVNYIMVRSSDGLVYFGLSGPEKADSPPCATAQYWMIADEKSNAGSQQYAMLLAAKTSGKPVIVYGRNTCTRWSDGEDVDSIQLVEPHP